MAATPYRAANGGNAVLICNGGNGGISDTPLFHGGTGGVGGSLLGQDGLSGQP
jgi:hypothetical protein